MRQRVNVSRLTPIAAVLLATGTMMGTANAATINTFNLDNIEADDSGSGGITAEVYQDPGTNADTNGFIDYGDSRYPGIEVYQEAFDSGSTTFAGCVMAALDEAAGDNCDAPPDSSKRIKLNATAATSASATSIPLASLPTADGIDLVFNTANIDTTENLYRWFGKLGNQTGGRLTGFRLDIGTGVGDSFTYLSIGDGLGVAEISGPFGNFPGGLFGGSKTSDTPFFSDQDADFIPTASDEDSIVASTVPATYAATFGNWLPLKWVPLAWFFDDDGNPATDDIIQAWFDGEKWIDGSGDLIPVSDLETWETTPPTVVEADGTTLYATWDYENEVYDLAGGGTLTLEDMNTDTTDGIPTTGRDRVPGHSIGAVEDLAKINVNFQIALADFSNDTITVRLTPIESTDVSTPPAWFDSTIGNLIPPISSGDQPVPPSTDTTTSTSGGGGGCTIGGNRPFDPLLPGLALAALGYLGLRRRWGA
ncbi:choice-of-anchor F family protein [Thioalkalivibrio sp.]|uniref:choice-of-anchor F family protein n=1 Tax=Thioalkalivibrio sp. TaxID=2093813 RepID=UPI003569552F